MKGDETRNTTRVEMATTGREADEEAAAPSGVSPGSLASNGASGLSDCVVDHVADVESGGISVAEREKAPMTNSPQYGDVRGDGNAENGDERRNGDDVRGAGKGAGVESDVGSHQEGSVAVFVSQPAAPEDPSSSTSLSSVSIQEGSKRRRGSIRSKLTSLQMRKVPDHILLGPDWEAADMNMGDDVSSDEDFLDDEKDTEAWARRGILQRTCLRPQFSLRTQLMLSFGIVSALTVLFVMAVSILISVWAGDSVRSSSEKHLESFSEEKASSSARYVSEAFAPMLPLEVSEILRQAVRDRFVGYPDAEGYEDDKFVPFRDMDSGTNMYPIDAPPLPLDWQIGQGNVNNTNFHEHVGDRWNWYGSPETTVLSTANAFFTMQGACDPSVLDPLHKNYHPNCTEASNDATLGGTVSPSPTTASIYYKGKDLSPFLKALYESSPIVKLIGMLFANSGAGAGVVFPHTEVDGTMRYKSIGCGWMLEAENPYKPGESIGTEEDIARCHSKDESVPSSEYNPLERGWCRDMALDPERVHFIGPYLDAGSEHLWVMSVGQAVYDRKTKEFIGCTLMDIAVDHMVDVLEKVRIGKSSLITLVKWDAEGTVVLSPNWDSQAANDVSAVDDPELEVGLSKEDFLGLKNLVNFSSPWDPSHVQQKYTSNVVKRDTKIVTGYPLPPPPPLYDESYRPSFMVIVTLEESSLFESFYDLGETVNNEVHDLIIFTLILGFAGMGGIFCVIFAVSVLLTRPLRRMKEGSDTIIGNFGKKGTLQERSQDGGAERSFQSEEPDKPMTRSDGDVGVIGKAENDKNIGASGAGFFQRLRCTPKTELSDLTHEFEKMVSQFSSDGSAAKAARLGSRLTEVRNRFSLQKEFDTLYDSRRKPEFKYCYQDDPKRTVGSDDKNLRTSCQSVSFDVPRHVHYGTNILATENEAASVSTTALLQKNDVPVVRSRLFRWIVCLVVIPPLAVTVTISVCVTWRVSEYFTRLNHLVQLEYLDLENQAATTAADLRAIHLSQIEQKASRELSLLTRFAGWLLFDGLNRTSSFTSMHSGAEECKMAGEKGKCDYLLNVPCDCAWGDTFAKTCTHFPETNDSRYLQELFFGGQRLDASPNGTRNYNYTSRPFETTSANRTSWWDDPLTVPGNEHGSSARGYETTYDRLRVISALSAIQIPLYNYDFSIDKSLSTYIGFEADGMMVGYGGCGHSPANYPFFKSSKQNGAAVLRPDLCPLGKYGYDARCRGWYHNGKEVSEAEEAPLYITPPYTFGGSDLVAQSATLPLVDPRNGEHVGMALLDFLSSAVVSSMKSTQLIDGGFPILITSRSDILKHDTVIGPNIALGEDAARLEEVVVPRDWSCVFDSDNCSSGTAFDSIAKHMREGGRGNSSFVRTGENGNGEEMYISYAPVTVTSYRPLNHSDFSRGTGNVSSLMYSLAFVQPKEALIRPFADYFEIERMVRISIGVLFAVIVLASALLIYISARVTTSITVPVLHLLKMIRSINRLENKEDFTPPNDGYGSSEVFAVNDTFSMLFKVVRFANTAFFSGDIEKAYWVLVDALRLFRKLKNDKAIGIASNNLGNCMLAMYRTMQATGESEMCGLSKADIISQGTAYFRDAIKLGEEAYDKFYEEQGWSGSCLVFMQHLSSRYFNRAIFLLTVKSNHKYPEEANRLGFQDLDIARNMDVEVVDQCLEVGFSVNKSDLFELMLNRLRGVLSLLEMDYPDEWGVEEQISNALRELHIALKNQSSDLFCDVSPAGRMQELDAELIRYARITNAIEMAAEVGIRMFMEDEYVFHHAELAAVKALVDYVALEDNEKNSTSETKQAILNFQDEIENEFMDNIVRRMSDARKSEEIMLCSRKSKHWKLQTESTRTEESHLSFSVRETCRGDFTMEIF